MSDTKEFFERVGDRFDFPVDAFDRLERRRDRKRRDQRIRAAVLGIAVVIAVGWLGINAIRSSPPAPADDPSEEVAIPEPAPLGALAYGMDGDIYVAEWDGSNPVKVADGLAFHDCHDIGEYWSEGPVWSPDGRYLAFRHTACDAARDGWWDVVITDRDGNVVTSFPSQGWNISWSPDSTRVAVWEKWGTEPGQEPGRTIGIYGIDGERQLLLEEPLGSPPTGESDPWWSPDGGSILLLSGLEIPLDGSEPRLVPFSDQLVAWMTYSPDGSHVAYPAKRSLVVAEADGSNPREVFGDRANNLVWSPAGDRLAFTSPAFSPDSRLHVLDVPTGEVTVVTGPETKEELDVIEFSPEGDRIYLSTRDDRDATRSLWSVTLDGSDLRLLVTGVFVWGDWRS